MGVVDGRMPDDHVDGHHAAVRGGGIFPAHEDRPGAGPDIPNIDQPAQYSIFRPSRPPLSPASGWGDYRVSGTIPTAISGWESDCLQFHHPTSGTIGRIDPMPRVFP